LDIDHKAAGLAQKLATHERQLVILLLKVVIEHDHLRETQRQKVHGIHAREAADHAPAKSGTLDEGPIIGPVTHIQAAEEVVIIHRNGPKFLVASHVLDIGLDERMHVAHLSHEEVLAFDDSVDYLVERCWLDRIGGR
jgi:hypothetical protein